MDILIKLEVNYISCYYLFFVRDPKGGAPVELNLDRTNCKMPPLGVNNSMQ